MLAVAAVSTNLAIGLASWASSVAKVMSILARSTGVISSSGLCASSAIANFEVARFTFILGEIKILARLAL